jgi:hypothetical protein
MKLCLFLILILLYPVFVQAQDIGFRVLSNVPNDQTLYTGKANIIELTNSTSNVTVKAKHGLIKMLSKTTFIIFEPYRNIPQTDYFQLGALTSDTLTLRTLQAPVHKAKPVAQGMIVCSMLPRPDLSKIDSAAIISSKAIFRVTGFTMNKQRRHGDWEGPAISTSNRLTQEQRNMLQSAFSEDIIYIDDVTWDCSGCKTFINPISLHQRIIIR